MPTQKIEELLSEGHKRFTPLQRLLTTATEQKSWTAQFRSVIDPELKPFCQVTAIRGPVASIQCTNAAVATRLRFMLPDLLPILNAVEAFSQVTEFNISVNGTG